jgi:hypothetical protein
MKNFRKSWHDILVLLAALLLGASPALAQQRPNILVIMGDDVGWFNIGAYHQGIMSGKTPNLDRLASQGMRFTDYYAEASCTAGRANFITGEIPLRTGLTTVGQAGADVGIPDQAVTLATARSRRRATPPASSARTIWATSTSTCRRCTASTSSSATCITSTRYRTRTGTRSLSTRSSTTATVRAV